MTAAQRQAAAWLAPAGFALLLACVYADAFVHPTFYGDQGARLDRAQEIVVGVGRRVWLPFLQMHIHALYLAGAPARAFLLVPFAYTVLSLFLLAALCRAALPDSFGGLAAAVLLLAAFAGSSFNWLGHTLYQEVIVIPIFLGLVYLHYFAPRRTGLFLSLLAVGMLTREVFWVWWLVFLALHWRERLRDRRRRAAALALAVIPAAWLVTTGQSPLLARNAEVGSETFEQIGARTLSLVRIAGAEWLLGAALCLAIVFAVAAAQRGLRGLSFRSYHVFSLISLAAIYLYIVIFDPWHATPGNTRALVPLFVHLLFWAILGWREASRLGGRAGKATRILAALGILSMLKLPAIAAALGGTPRRGGDAWEPLHLTTRVAAREDWRAVLGRTLAPLRAAGNTPLRVVFVGVPRSEYLKYWVAPFLYDQRRTLAAAEPIPAADLLIAPAEWPASGWLPRQRLRLPGGLAREVLFAER